MSANPREESILRFGEVPVRRAVGPGAASGIPCCAVSASAPVLTVLHVSPHPDDEAIGAGATLMALRDAGHRVLNLATSLGRPDDHDRRRTEVEEACRRACFELLVHDPPLPMSSGDDLAAAEAALVETLLRLLPELDVGLVVSSSPHDGHHAHELVGRAVAGALRATPAPPPWWMWGLWDDLPLPTVVTLFEEPRLEEVLGALAAHVGELDRNDYPAMVTGRAAMNRVLGMEKAFGFGSEGVSAAYAELLMEALLSDGTWHAGLPRVLRPEDPFADAGPGPEIGWWLEAVSFRDRLGAPTEE